MKCSIYILDQSNSAHLCRLYTNKPYKIVPQQSDAKVSINTEYTDPSTIIKASSLQVSFFLQQLDSAPNFKRHVIEYLKTLDAPIIVHTILPSNKALDYTW